jgi:hypothetical protein
LSGHKIATSEGDNCCCLSIQCSGHSLPWWLGTINSDPKAATRQGIVIVVVVAITVAIIIAIAVTVIVAVIICLPWLHQPLMRREWENQPSFNKVVEDTLSGSNKLV